MSVFNLEKFLRILKALILRGVLLRNYFHLKHRRGKNASANLPNDLKIFFDLKDLGLESYYCFLILSFIEKGFKVFIQDNLWFIANCRSHMRQVLRNPDISIIKRPQYLLQQEILFVYDLQSTSSKFFWKKIIHINLKIYQPKNRIHLSMPYQMSPHIYLSETYQSVNALRKKGRSMRIFFSGNQDENAYNSRCFQLFFQKMNRLEVLLEIRNRLTGNQLTHSLPTMVSQGYLNKMILLNWAWSPNNQANLERRVDNSQWLESLAQSHFFLCPPGIRTPFCHHTIESMAVGTIPILEYAELFDPPLVHMENAIVFSGADDLIEKINIVLALDEPSILKMQQQVGDYYDQYMQLTWTAEQIMKSDYDHIELYINGEEKSYSKEMKKMI